MRKLSLVAALACAACSSGSSTKDAATHVAATPAFSVAAGTQTQPISVAITSSTAGAVIRYTTDGADPTEASSTYSAPLAISTATTVKAVATAPGLDRSAVAAAAYAFRVAAPAFSLPPGTYATAQEVALSTATPGATLHCTTDGTDPSAGSGTCAGTIALPVGGAPQTTVIKVLGVRAGFTDSAIQSATYTIDAGATPAATPTFSPGPGTYPSAQSVQISSTTTGAELHCTTDGTPATSASPVCAGAISVAATTTIRAVATAPGHTASVEATAAYTIGGGGSGSDWMAFCGTKVNKEKALRESCGKVNPALHAVPYTSDLFCLFADHAITAGRVRYDRTVGAACASALAAVGCAGLDRDGSLEMPAACAGILTGTVALAGHCDSTLDCATGYCTGQLALACNGTCHAFAGNGEGCESDAVCADGLVCDTSRATPVCVPAGGVDGACPCEDGLWCDESGPTPTCRAPRTSGACVVNEECAFGHACQQTAEGPACAPVAGAGADCSTAPCADGYECAQPQGVCTSIPTPGQPCGNGPQCAAGYCSEGTCTAYRFLGAECSSGAQCATMACDGGHCSIATCAP